MARFMLLATSILGLLGSALALPASKPDLQLDAAQDADTTNRINNCGAPCVDACMIECTDAQGTVLEERIVESIQQESVVGSVDWI